MLNVNIIDNKNIANYSLLKVLQLYVQVYNSTQTPVKILHINSNSLSDFL